MNVQKIWPMTFSRFMRSLDYVNSAASRIGKAILRKHG
jgi:hypothetical protein